MELVWCRSFLAVHEQGGFTAASRTLHRSQSRISAHVAALEAELGAQLFHRDVHPPTLTAAGTAFLPHARATVTEWQSALAAVAAGQGQVRGNVAVGSVPSVSAMLIAPLLAEFSETHPEVRFEVHEGANNWLDEALAHRTIELGISPMEITPRLGIAQRALLTDPFRAVVPFDHPAASAGFLELEQLVGKPVITTGEAGLDPHVGLEFRELLEHVEFDYERSLAVTQPTTVFSFVRAGLGIGIMGALGTRIVRDNSLVVVPVNAENASRKIGLRWANTRRLSPAASAFADALEAMVDREIAAGRLEAR
ncbi:LysR family transcriptional regulator [Salinibacterium sp. UTAS2018]|uniref:LysR family transcriptional regulator n=1 Tax=Salinibacterium sp. UTAS2018 TaxID=2508880 RepID=UPI0010096DC1|nr:LysR family transcriptional regulator [Salinibacterium sp. UTAS2018]QAV70944.1 LysR family transcriptional regulator [Salinibacterium sp. UTAS2018]